MMGSAGFAGVPTPRLIRPAVRRVLRSPRLTGGASERTVKSRFTGQKGPNSDHLIALARNSDSVFGALLQLCGREPRAQEAQLAQARKFLTSAMALLGGGGSKT
jgi:hypothetical protein